MLDCRRSVATQTTVKASVRLGGEEHTGECLCALKGPRQALGAQQREQTTAGCLGQVNPGEGLEQTGPGHRGVVDGGGITGAVAATAPLVIQREGQREETDCLCAVGGRRRTGECGQRAPEVVLELSGAQLGEYRATCGLAAAVVVDQAQVPTVDAEAVGLTRDAERVETALLGGEVVRQTRHVNLQQEASGLPHLGVVLAVGWAAATIHAERREGVRAERAGVVGSHQLWSQQTVKMASAGTARCLGWEESCRVDHVETLVVSQVAFHVHRSMQEHRSVATTRENHMRLEVELGSQPTHESAHLGVGVAYLLATVRTAVHKSTLVDGQQTVGH
mmetsp:Transcript_13341/g.40289  ORF Transcript_13341/g.40289 Transcript_13341/m.40289 type:complete len:334 (+) Transcript_13341:231-1232(+)